jgi:hypothetical protein
MSKTYRADGSLRAPVALSNNLLIGYFVTVSMVALLWAGVHGASWEGAPKPSREVRRCVELKDDASNLRCYDHAAQGVTLHPAP